MNKRINSIGIVFICILASVLRIIARKSDLLIYIVSFTNIISLWYVILCICNYSYHRLNKLLEASDYTKKVRTRKIKFLTTVTNLCMFSFTLLAILYFILWNNETANDIISIIALTGSLITEDFSEWIASIFLLKK